MHGEGTSSDKSLGQQTLLVRRSDLEKLSTEAMMLKEFLPKVLNHEYVAMIGKLSHVEQGKFGFASGIALYVHAAVSSSDSTSHKEKTWWLLVQCLVVVVTCGGIPACMDDRLQVYITYSHYLVTHAVYVCKVLWYIAKLSWGYKTADSVSNQENTQKSPGPFLTRAGESGDETVVGIAVQL